MSTQSDAFLFISHASRDEELLKRLINVLLAALPLSADQIICSSVDGCRLASGETIEAGVMDRAKQAASFLAVLSPQSAQSNWVLFELGARWGSKKGISLRLLGVPGFSLQSLGPPFAGRVIARAENDSELHSLIGAINRDLRLNAYHAVNPAAYARPLEEFGKLVDKLKTIDDSETGVVSREGLLNSDRKLLGEVFAIEMLEHPVLIERNQAGDLQVTVDRRDVRQMVISNAGKTAEVTKIIGEHNRRQIEAHDRELQEFLANQSPGRRTTDPPDGRLSLRWASGGVLSIVNRGGKKWVPFFFRDIRPYGWNISLGQTERPFVDNNVLDQERLKEELKEPWRYISREFIEESLILSHDPRRHTLDGLKLKRLRVRNAGQYGGEHDREHLQQRLVRDRLEIELPEDPHNVKDALDITERVAPWSKLKVICEGPATVITEDVLVCFSLLDLGIEIVKVFEYDMEKPETMLDGEIIEKRHPNTDELTRELVRMPIALMSLDYLERTFFARTDWQNYTEGPQPSIEVFADAQPGEDDIELFPYDVTRRMEILKSGRGTWFEQERYLDWYDCFRENFLDAAGQPSCAKPSRLFVPGTAKILNLYFHSRAHLAEDRRLEGH